METRSAHAEVSTLHVRRSYVLETHGSAAVSELISESSPPLQSVLRGSGGKEEWVDFALFIELNVLIDRMFGEGDYGLVREVGRYAAEHNAGSWRALFEKGIDIAKFMGIASGLWRKHYDSGSLTTSPAGDNALELVIKNFAQPHRTHCLSVAGWLEGVLEFKSGVTALVEEKRCRASGDSACEFLITWSEDT